MTDGDHLECIVCGEATVDNLVLGNGDNVPYCPGLHSDSEILNALQEMESDGESSSSEGSQSEGSSVTNQVNADGEPPKTLEPDAWRWIEEMTDVDGNEKEVVSHSEEHPSSDEVQFYMSEDHDWKDAVPLYAPDTIQEVIEEVWHSFTPKELLKDDLNGARKMKNKLKEAFSDD